ncbi:MAG TPA: type I restriction endonuclease subunit R [Micromonosporaceae bacterium]
MTIDDNDPLPPLNDLTESEWEELATETLAELAWMPKEGRALGPGSGERPSWSEPILVARLRAAIARINPQLPPSAVDDAVSEVTSAKSRDAITENKRVHDLMTQGVRAVSYTDEHGARHNPTVWVIDFRDLANNDFVVANQVRVLDGEAHRRFDVVAYLNGLPVAIMELKKGGDESATLDGAQAQLSTYVKELPLAFRGNVITVISDGITARYGTAFTPYEHYAVWNVDHEGKRVPTRPKDADGLALTVLLNGLFDQRRFLEILRGHVTFAQTQRGLVKRVAKAHQYFAVSRAVGKTVEAVRSDGRAGVVWHTQGSGKSLEMELFANQVATHPALGNPTIVVLTDRTDLDDQLFQSFQESQLLPEQPRQVTTREEMRAELTNRTVGGIIFSTLQKFGRTKEEREMGRNHPPLSERRNIVLIVDEAHRSHYDTLDGYARHLRDALPNATLIAFTGTPLSFVDRNTRDIFGGYIDVYDLTRAVDDGATVRVFHESRLAPLHIALDVDPDEIDERADQLVAGLDEAEQERVRQLNLAMNQLYGAPDRLRTIAKDLVEHWEQRSAQMRPLIGGPGKAMVVCATRNICARLYKEIVALRPEWHDDTNDNGRIKVIYTGEPSETDAEVSTHVRRPSVNKVIMRRAKDPDDPLEIIIVQSMLLTGFDSPALHTMYMDKPMRGAALMQALARVNRTYRDKPSGLLVGYAPIIDSLHQALAEYTTDDQANRPVDRDISEAAAAARDMHDVVRAMFRGYDWKAGLASRSRKAFLETAVKAVNYLKDPASPGNEVADPTKRLVPRFRDAASKLERLYSVCSTSGELNPIRDDIAFFTAVKVYLAKFDAEDRRARGLPQPADIEIYLREYTASIIEADGVKDIFAEIGLSHPDLSHIDEAYLARLRASKTPRLTVESLRRLIEQTMRRTTRHNIVRQQSYAARLEELMRRYTNQHLTSAEIIAELAELAKEVSADSRRGTQFSPPLNDDELAFYDAVATNDSAVDVMGIGVLADIARDLVRTMRSNVTVDWVSRDDVRARMRTTIKRLLAKYGYPPDAEPTAVELVIRQMETFADEWTTGQSSSKSGS